MPIVLFLLLGIFSSTSWAACEVTKETCLQGPETRIIGGEEIFRECWQWEVVSECESGGSVNYCEPLESLSFCQQTETNCLDSSVIPVMTSSLPAHSMCEGRGETGL